MRILICVPNVHDFYFTPHRFHSLGPETAYELIRARYPDTELVVFPLLNRHKPTPLSLPDYLTYLAPHLLPDESGPLSFFTAFKRWGPPLCACVETVKSRQPDLVFVACFAFSYAEEALALGTALKAQAPGLLTVACGAGASVFPAFFLNAGSSPAFDYVYCGEAESRLLDFIDSVSHGTPLPRENLASLENPNPPLVPAAAPDLKAAVSLPRRGARRVYLSAQLSRGCVYSCSFCANRLVFGTKFKTVPLNVVDLRLQEIARDLGTTLPVHINLEDDNLLLAPDYLWQLLSLFRRHFPGCSFSLENGLDYRLLDRPSLTRLIDLGCSRLNLTLGNIDDLMASQNARSLDLERYQEIVKLAAARAVPSVTYVIAGMSWDSPENTVANLAFLHKQPTQIGLSLFYPVPGLPDFPPAKMRLFPPGLSRGSAAWPWTGSLSTAAMVTAFRLARLANCLKAPQQMPFLLPLLRRIRSEKRLYTLRSRPQCIQAVLHTAENMVESFLGRIL